MTSLATTIAAEIQPIRHSSIPAKVGLALVLATLADWLFYGQRIGLSLTLFAIAMAWVEAASVFYIRALVDRIEPYQADPLPMNGALGRVELWREAATLVMIATLGLLAGGTWRRRAGYAALAFGTWDIAYYVCLRLISGWPRTLLDWDILFLLPLPWWGPVLAPVSIALVMILWGTLATQLDDGASDSRWAWALGAVGIVVALAVFMIDAWRALPDGRDAVLRTTPDSSRKAMP